MLTKFGIFVFAAYVCSVTGVYPICGCTKERNPVCGQDGVSYANPCLMKCNNQERRQYGECPENPLPRPCNCRPEDKPVCGSNGITYNNECELNCYSSLDKSGTTVASTGPCEPAPANDPGHSDDGCGCTDEYRPLCGSDRKIYSNRCQFNCALASNPSLTEASPRRCLSPVIVVDPFKQ